MRPHGVSGEILDHARLKTLVPNLWKSTCLGRMEELFANPALSCMPVRNCVACFRFETYGLGPNTQPSL